MSEITLIVEENQRVITSPAFGGGVTTVNIHDDYMDVMKQGFQAGQKFLEDYEELKSKVLNRKKKGGIFSERYSEKDLRHFCLSNMPGYNVEKDFSVEKFIVFTSFIKGVNEEVYDSLYKGLETMMLGVASIDKEVNAQNVSFLHLTYNLLQVSISEFVNLDEYNKDPEEKKSFLTSLEVFQSLTYQMFYLHVESFVKLAKEQAKFRIDNLIKLVNNNDIESFDEDNLLDIKGYLAVYAKNILCGDSYIFVDTGVSIADSFGIKFRSISAEDPITDEQLGEIENFIGVEFEGWLESDENGIRIVKFFKKDLTPAMAGLAEMINEEYQKD